MLIYSGMDRYLNGDSVEVENRVVFKNNVRRHRLPYRKIELHGLTIGCDLEAEYSRDGKSIVHAEEAIGDNFGDTRSPLGYDGALNVVEVRPGIFPANEPEKLFDAIQNLWNTAKVKGNFTYVGNRYSIGLHLHLGHVNGLPVGKSLIKALNRYIGHLCYNGNGSYRLNSHYGEVSDTITSNGDGGSIETKAYGFEYRVPPAWIAADKKAFCTVYKIFVAVYKAWIQGKIGKVDSSSVGRKNEYEKLGIKWSDVEYVLRHCNRKRKNSRDVKCYS